MANNRIKLEGFAEIRAWLRTLPEHLTDEASSIVFGAADDAETDAAFGYASRGAESLKNALKVDKKRGRFGVTAVLKNTHPHALPYEYGTQVRYTHLGYNRGRMPPANVFKPAAERARRDMYDDLATMMTREGFVVG